MRRVLVILVASLAAFASWADTQVRGVRAWPAPDHTRVVFDVTGPVKHQIFQLSNPSRLVIDVKATSWASARPAGFAADKLVKSLRYGRRQGRDLRIVLDLHEKVQPKASC